MSEASEVGRHHVVRRNPEAIARRIDDLTFVMHPHRRELHHFNETAWFVWEGIDGKRTVEDLARLVAAEYEVELAQAAADVAELVATLADKDLVVVEPATSKPSDGLGGG